jgi:hypothetical protein
MTNTQRNVRTALDTWLHILNHKVESEVGGAQG